MYLCREKQEGDHQRSTRKRLELGKAKKEVQLSRRFSDILKVSKSLGLFLPTCGMPNVNSCLDRDEKDAGYIKQPPKFFCCSVLFC